jgi:hypothetical protein
MKICYQCHESKPETEFYIDRSKPDGLKGICKPCDRIRAAKAHLSRPRHPVSVESQKCRCCLQNKPAPEFHREPINSSGLKHECIECFNRRVRAYQRNNPDKKNDRSKFRLQSPEFRLLRNKKRRELYRRQLSECPEKIHARSAVARAIVAGRLIRSPCEVCGKSPAQAHHKDYSKPLEVVWLCQPCHGVVRRLKP